MKFLMLCLLAAGIVGGIYYRAEISEYVDNIANAASGSDSGWSATDSMQHLGQAAGGAMSKAADAFDR